MSNKFTGYRNQIFYRQTRKPLNRTGQEAGVNLGVIICSILILFGVCPIEDLFTL